MSLNQPRTTLAKSGNLRLHLLLLAILLLLCLPLIALAQQSTAREIAFPVTIRWDRQKRINRYRLQIAADDKFQNVFLDRRVVGDRYIVSELSSGYYYWRVAPAESQVGDFSRPARFFISGGVVVPVKLNSRVTRQVIPSSTFGLVGTRKRQPKG